MLSSGTQMFPAQLLAVVHASPAGRLVDARTLHVLVAESQLPPVSQVLFSQQVAPLEPQQNPRLSQVSGPPVQVFALEHAGKHTGDPLSELWNFSHTYPVRQPPGAWPGSEQPFRHTLPPDGLRLQMPSVPHSACVVQTLVQYPSWKPNAWQ